MSEKRKNTYHCSKIPLHKNFKLVLEQNVTEQAYLQISCMYSGGQNIVDTLYMFYLYALTLGANNF